MKLSGLCLVFLHPNRLSELSLVLVHHCLENAQHREAIPADNGKASVWSCCQQVLAWRETSTNQLLCGIFTAR